MSKTQNFIIISKKSIVINNKHIITEAQYRGAGNKEQLLKEKFIEILKDNIANNSVIKLIDLKNAYQSKLPASLQKDAQLVQILKNLIGSNKNNRTHMLRCPNVDWYYCEKTKNNYIEVDDTQRKPMPLPDKLETAAKKGSKIYYVFYSSIVADSIITTSIEATENNQSHKEENYDTLDFDNIRNKKIDYLKKQEEAEKLGRIGEEYVLKLEKEKLIEEGIKIEPIWVSAKNDSYGFDILSYRKDDKGNVNHYYIEVKTTNGGLYNKFYVTDNELSVSKKYKSSYALYRVYDAGDINTISYKVYDGDIESNKKLEKKEYNRVYAYSVKK